MGASRRLLVLFESQPAFRSGPLRDIWIMEGLGLSGPDGLKGGRFAFDRDGLAADFSVSAAGSASCSALLLTSSAWFVGSTASFSLPLPAVER